jgi:hypothetical protein
MRKLITIMAIVVTWYGMCSAAEARCGGGQILIRHTGACMDKAEARSKGIYGRRGRHGVEVTPTVMPPGKKDPSRMDQLPHDDELGDKCSAWRASRWGWPGQWISSGGLTARGRWAL